MQNFQDTFDKRPFISAFLICMTIPLTHSSTWALEHSGHLSTWVLGHSGTRANGHVRHFI